MISNSQTRNQTVISTIFGITFWKDPEELLFEGVGRDGDGGEEGEGEAVYANKLQESEISQNKSKKRR